MELVKKERIGMHVWQSWTEFHYYRHCNQIARIKKFAEESYSKMHICKNVYLSLVYLPITRPSWHKGFLHICILSELTSMLPITKNYVANKEQRPKASVYIFCKAEEGQNSYHLKVNKCVRMTISNIKARLLWCALFEGRP